ncbi:MAG TPA: AbrB/MazE/SpoVT family DNA-binding domain-containing protein [Candidatus Nanoarchaeia archaeon]|nr:AbrB/MazE/SpoVT family DNA-binding domain-containing protein [Candidatus Nanoarchaeia archaeon]
MVIAKKWGSSVGVILPKEVVESQGIKAGDDLVIRIFRKGNLKDVFGKLKTKIPGQKFKDIAKEGWS